MPSLAEMYGDFRNRVSKQHFGPGQSVIWSTINDPKLAAEKAADWLNQSYASAGSYDPYGKAVPEKAIESALGLAGLLQTGAMPFAPSGAGTLGSIKASHGSPHSFEKFLMSKLGTGEGNQAYGHGLYFAEGHDSPVAQSYISAGQAMKAPDRTTEMVARALDASGGIESKAKEWLASRIKTSPAEFHDLYNDAIARFDEVKPSGSLYNVELRWPDAAREAADPLGPEHFLHWDKPMIEQAPAIRKAWQATKQHLPENALEDLGGDLSLLYGHDVTPEDFLGTMSSIGGNPNFGEQLLRKQGIPGIRYLDQGSRGAGQGTHNYVVFDENIPNIVSRNGVSLSDLLRR